ncbi:phosphotransferase family protein [Alicyclobacillus ferrooxydans]|uniref:phosphotransferase family protein n=1 Tax=Alicyclobacillus ferrooxydans TaxID=471514 RepID=UPI0006D58FA7|nr:aminoglycoside phosphotransferase family protein [Alicyclobacillus ferrooxydans]
MDGLQRLDGPDGWETGLQAFTDHIMEDVVPLLNAPTGNSVTREITAFLGEKQHFDFQPVLIHGDLSPEHILVNKETGEIGVIDFGDSGIGDPAYDVMDELMPSYGGQIDGSFQARQRFYRRLAPFHSVLHGVATGDEALVSDGLREVVAEFGE